jgi:3-methylcrotonyl-CoA carboxylase beta subunit
LYQENERSLRETTERLRDLVRKTSQGGGERAVQKHLEKGKLMARDRINELLDLNSDFLELSPLAAHECYAPDHIPGAGLVTGIGQVAGRQVMVVANDATVKGGTYFSMSVKKHLRYWSVCFAFERRAKVKD